MRAKTDNALGEAFRTVRHVWRHRKGNEIPAAVDDTIETLWKEGMRPVIVKRVQLPTGWFFIVHLPPGINYHDFKSKEQYFRDATGGAVQIEKKKKAVNLTVMTDELKNSYPFSWDYRQYGKMSLPVHFGYSAMGPIVSDLADAPNLIIAGHPGAGKSNFLHVLVACLLLSREVLLLVIDLKRLEFSYLRDHALVITDQANALKLLQAVNKELDKRLATLEAAGVVKIQDYRGDMTFVVLIIDELAELQDEDCQEQLNRIVRLGRAAGICVVAATQRPSSTMFKKFGDSKAMFAATMCFHVRDEVNSRMLLDNDRAAIIPNIPGRAIYQWDHELEVQTMFLPVSKARKLLSASKRQVNVNELYQPPKRLPPR